MADRTPDIPERPHGDPARLDSLPVPACLCSADGSVLKGNASWDSLLQPHGVNGTAPAVDEAERNVRAHLREAVASGLPADIEIAVRDADGQQRSFAGRCGPVDVPSLPDAVALCVVSDISEIRRREAQLAFMATHDPLTGLPNRRMFDDALLRAMARARRGKPGALLMLDIDNLKSYNDALGHNQGDQALVNFALLLQTHVRAGDMLARVGGDEFGVVLDAATLDEAVEIGERMRSAAAEEPFVADARAFDLGLSGGIVSFDGSEEIHTLADAADAALYEAKESGRNRLVVGATGAASAGMYDARLAARIREALNARRFRVHYQPVVRLSDGQTAYFESLVRMVGESGELEMPSSFLSTTERLGLMPRLTRLVVDEVTEAMATIATARVSLNLSASDLLDRTLPEHIQLRLAETRVDASRLLFEVAEADAAAHRSSMRAWLDRFQALGCTVVLDRFGAGERGLSLTQEFSFDQVKLDVTTLVGLTGQDGDAGYLETIRRVVESHGLTAVASRIEDPAVMKRVRQAGFGLVQGFDVGEPRVSPS
ncbi:MAG: EAL domain-containing protein [Coriobacteriia bacterium]|nr:EAL domain-containing protein [Coriobacteriia bacterium]